MKTNSYKKDNSDDIGKLSASMSTKTEELHSILSQTYTPENFEESELDAIAKFTSDPSGIHQSMSAMSPDADVSMMPPEYDGDDTYQTIAAMDSATNKIATPIEFEAYIALGDDVDVSQFRVGAQFRFNTFRSASIDPSMVLHSGPVQPGQTKRTTYILQIDVAEGTPGLYAEDFSSSPEEYEFIFARGVPMTVTQAPNKIVGSSATFNVNNHEIYYITCST